MTTPDFSKMVPGFDFLQGLMKGTGNGLPGIGQWIAPTLDAEEVDKRIQELRTVQFWLEQNVKMMAATIQALEVQRMTLATLKTMNLPLGDVRDAMKIDPSAFTPKKATSPDQAESAAAPAPAAAGTVDPMQWWGALTRQFTELAANAIKDSPMQAATDLAGAALKQAVQPMADVAKAVSAGAKAVRKTPARKAGGAAKTSAKAAPASAQRKR